MTAYEHELDTAIRAVTVAGEKALAYFGRGGHVRRKGDGSPVTDADLASEQAFLQIVTTAYPDDGILAEESGAAPSRSGRRWIVDPIDGTKGFTRGVPFWSVLAALEDRGEIVAGVAHFPAFGVTYAARKGGGCFRNDQRVHCRGTERLSDAIVQMAELGDLLGSSSRDLISDIAAAAWVTRSIGDALAGCMVLDGSCDVWLERGLRPYDIAPFYVLAPEAGAIVSDWNGARDVMSLSILVASPALHTEVLQKLGSSTVLPSSRDA